VWWWSSSQECGRRNRIAIVQAIHIPFNPCNHANNAGGVYPVVRLFWGAFGAGVTPGLGQAHPSRSTASSLDLRFATTRGGRYPAANHRCFPYGPLRCPLPLYIVLSMTHLATRLHMPSMPVKRPAHDLTYQYTPMANAAALRTVLSTHTV